METKEFLQSVLSNKGSYCVWGYKGDSVIQKFYSSVDEAIEQTKYLDSNNYNTFYALATFKEDGSRKVDNIQYLKSFFLDLDCGETKDYPNKGEALTALRHFCQKVKLPKPVIVDSGNGVHCYWPLETEVEYKDWFPVAEKLKLLCAEYNLLADPAVTSDGARVLRVPGSHNFKGNTPLQVKVLGNTQGAHVFQSFSATLGDIETTKEKLPPSATKEKLHDNMENVFMRILQRTVKGNGCEQIKYIIKNQATISEPLWRGGLSIAKFCVDADKASINISKKHPEYSEEKTIDKMNRIEGPYLCSTFDQHNPDICPSCPFWGKIKSPLVLGSRIKESDEEIEEALGIKSNMPKYPSPYFRGKNGGVYVRYSNADGDPEDKLIYHNDLYVVSRLKDPETGEGVVMRLHLPKDGVREFTVPLTAVTSREEFRKHMAMQGVAVTKMDELMTYTTAWVNELQLQGEADIAHKQYGWIGDSQDRFIVGKEEITKDSEKSNPPSTQTISTIEHFEPKGSLEKWKEMANFYNRDNFEIHQFVLATAFGSPLMRFTTLHCGVLHLNGDTGIGKSTVQEACLSVWGDPKELMCNVSDTAASMMNRAEVFHNLPLILDELTNSDSSHLSDLAYQLTNGRQRNRMSGGSNVERYRGLPWQLLAVTSANLSIVDKIGLKKAMPKAEAQRILECKTKEMRFETKEETDAFNSLLYGNYGHAGKVYIKSILNDIEGTKELLKKVQIKIDTVAGLTAKNRFWSALCACSMTGIIIAKKLGLVDYDTKKLFQFIIKQLKKNVHSSNDMGSSVEEVLNDYIHEHYSNVLWIKSTDDLRADASTLVVPEAVPRGKLVARYETDLKKVFLLPKPLKRWCGEHQIDYSSFTSDLKEKLGATKGKVRLSKGTHLNLPPAHVIIVDCKIGIEDETRSSEEL